ncbi:MAG TPA: hypothetical protein VLK25_12485 [Allosphingosinicella sp.]|nr:hypothetical protein [Allosphingosinicella sp.]
MVGHIKIPKRIGAVKVPKQVRKKARKAIRAAASPFVRDFAGAAVAAAHRVRREAEELKDRVQRETEEFRDRAKEWKEFRMCEGEDIRIDGSKVAEAFRDAAIAGIRSFLEGLDESLRKAKADAEAAGADPQPEPRAKPAKARVRVKVKAAAKPAPKAKAKPKKPRASRSSPGAARPA